MPYKDRTRRLQYITDYAANIRSAVQDLYGCICKHCSNTDRRVLEIDHINRAREPKKHYHRSGVGLWRQILKGYKPLSDFQLLCRNCNFIKVLENHEHQPVHKTEIPSSQRTINA